MVVLGPIEWKRYTDAKIEPVRKNKESKDVRTSSLGISLELLLLYLFTYLIFKI